MRAERRERRRRIGAVLERLGYVEWRPPPELGPTLGRLHLGRARRAFVSLLARAVKMASPPDPDPAELRCLFWGDAPPPHMDCDVVAVCGCQGTPPDVALPAVCPCECKVCKRAWWTMGRPRIVEGKVVRR